MNRPEARISKPRWRALGSATLALAAVTIIGLTSIAPARANDNDWRYRRGWHEREWREHREGWREHRPSLGFYFNSPAPDGYYQPYYQNAYDYDRAH